jgi:prepilin-type N-terminal cleavage/methylation domain-containing protein
MKRAFTLLEMMIVIGVVLLLAGLSLSVGVAVIEQSERRQTEAVLQMLDTAVKEWEVTADRKLLWWQTGDDLGVKARADVRADTREIMIITEVLDVISRPAAVREILAGIDPDLVYVYQRRTATPWLKHGPDGRFVGSLTVLDAWGKPIYATHPGRVWTEADGQGSYALDHDDDGTIRTYNEKRYGVAPNRQVVFVSAGPDGRFGLPDEFPDLGPGEHAAAIETARRDNLYSLPVVYALY